VRLPFQLDTMGRKDIAGKTILIAANSRLVSALGDWSHSTSLRYQTGPARGGEYFLGGALL
jgi:hypothetical protein